MSFPLIPSPDFDPPHPSFLDAMKTTSFTLFLAMLFVNDIWAVYGVGLPPRATQNAGCNNCMEFVNVLVAPTQASPTPFETPLPASQPPATSPPIGTASPTFVTPPAAPPVPDDTHTASSTPTLTTPAILGISISLTLSIFLILFLIFGMPYLRRYRRARALRRAVEEVERGTEMHKDVSHRNLSESKENMVLESRVEIVVDDGESERDVVDAWDGWNASWDEDEEEEQERGRKGMSLPRREY